MAKTWFGGRVAVVAGFFSVLAHPHSFTTILASELLLRF